MTPCSLSGDCQLTKQLAVLFCEAVASSVFVSVLSHLTSLFPLALVALGLYHEKYVGTENLLTIAFLGSWGKAASKSFHTHLSEYFIFKYYV